MSLQKNIHFYFGIIVVAHFAITGLEMRLNLFSVSSDDTLTRMMFRANHIYILFSGIMHLLVNYTLRDEYPINRLQITASGILIIATIALNISFYLEPTTHTFTRTITSNSIKGCFLGAVIHLLLLQFYYKRLSRAKA